MIVLDASVAIALFDRGDLHHRRAIDLVRARIDQTMTLHVVTRAEVLVGPTKVGRAAEVTDQIDGLEIGTVGLQADEAPALARVRADTGLRLPDACVVLAAQRLGATIATFDDRLHRAAEGLGVPVV